MDAVREIANLRDKLEQVREELLYKENIIQCISAQEQHFPSDWLLADKERRLLGALARKGACSKDQLITAMYADVREDDWPLDVNKCLSVTLTRLRAKTEPQGIIIPSFKGGEVSLQPYDLMRLRMILQHQTDPGVKPRKTRIVAHDPRQHSFFDLNTEEGDAMIASS